MSEEVRSGTGKRPVHGVLLLDKPQWASSNQALQKARWHFHAQKAGHTGVLDPMATGLLPVCFGEATKFSSYLLDADKAYRATMRLGQVTRTGDTEGEVIETHPVQVDEAELQAVMTRFVGEIEQIPPMYSALKFEGRALYEYARQGIHIERAARRITIYSLQLVSFDGVTAILDVCCSKGTYIRTLAQDLGAALGCGAHLTGLRRTRTAGFDVADAHTLEALEALSPEARLGVLLPVDILVQYLPAHYLSVEEAAHICHGQPVRLLQKDAIIPRFRLYDETTEQFMGLGEVRSDGQLWPDRLLAFTPPRVEA